MKSIVGPDRGEIVPRQQKVSRPTSLVKCIIYDGRLIINIGEERSCTIKV